MHPTTLYHKTEKPQIVTSEEARDALLRDGWADTPAAFYPKNHPGAQKPVSSPSRS